jgi:DNA mismatch repair protein MutS
LFYEDVAARAARLLNITLIARGTSAGSPVRMVAECRSFVEQYSVSTGQARREVAICEQIGEVTGGKGPVERQVVRIVTPGTLTDTGLLQDRTDAPLLAVAAPLQRGGNFGLAWLILASGELRATSVPSSALASELARIAPSEGLVPDAWADTLGPALRQAGAVAQPRPDWHFDAARGTEGLREALQVATLEAFGVDDAPELLAAAAALLDYARSTQGGRLPHIAALKREANSDYIVLDPSTRRNLEITATLRADDGPTLLRLLDHCQTAMGSRRLRHWLHHPRRDPTVPRTRHRAIAALLGSARSLQALQQALRGLPDLERIATRISLRSARPRELERCATLPSLERLAGVQIAPAAPLLTDALSRCRVPPDTVHLLGALHAEPPIRCAMATSSRRDTMSNLTSAPCATTPGGSSSTWSSASALAPESATCASSTTACTASTSRSRTVSRRKSPTTTGGARP